MNILLEAIHFAAIKHCDQRRKDVKSTPYINHPIEVMNLLNRFGVSEVDTLMAAVLHDTIEDTATTFDEIQTTFNSNVANIVKECTDDKSLPKAVRKQLQIEHVKTASLPALLVKLGDKYSNLKDLMENPPKTWSPEEITGYMFWSYAVISEIKKRSFESQAKVQMEGLLDNLFAKFGMTSIDDTVLQSHLDEYYAKISQSE